MNQRIANKLNSLAVSAYKMLGSLLLVLILMGLVSYISVQGYFFLTERWVAPKVVSPTDPEILQLNAQLAQQTAARDRLQAEQRETRVRLAQAEQFFTAERDFQKRFQEALRAERKARSRALRRLVALRQEYLDAAQEISASNRAFAGLQRTRDEALYSARLVEREQHLTTNHQLAQLAQSNLSLAEREAELLTRLEALQRGVAGLDATLRGAADGLTPETLLLEREYTRSVLETTRLEGERRGLEESLEALDVAVTRYEKLLASIRSSPWMEAFERGLTVAFVPYANLENARVGTPVYRCALRLLWCKQVGVVGGQPLVGEVSVKHPVRQLHLRGVMVELKLEDERWAQEDLLHLGRPPLLL